MKSNSLEVMPRRSFVFVALVAKLVEGGRRVESAAASAVSAGDNSLARGRGAERTLVDVNRVVRELPAGAG